MQMAQPKGSLLRGTALLLLLLASLGGSRAVDVEGSGNPAKCSLAGVWKNELGSQMEIAAADTAGHFTGSYQTAVSTSNKPVAKSLLQGVQHPGAQSTFGFAVDWISTETTTVFVGQCFVTAKGKEVLQTLWLLRDAVGSIGEDWKATRVGHNVFWREE